MKLVNLPTILICFSFVSAFAGDQVSRRIAANSPLSECQTAAIAEMTKFIHTQESDYKKGYVVGPFAEMSNDANTITQQWQYGPPKAGNYVCATIQCTYTGDINGACTISACSDNQAGC